jgi:hypothetical protein
MEKLVYVLWGPGDGPGTSGTAAASATARADAFVRELHERVAPELLAQGAQGLTLHLADAEARAVERARITHLDPPPAGLASFWLDAADDRGPCERALARATAKLAGYLVVESVPLRNTTRTAPLGRRTPGIVMVALIERPARLAWDDWIAHWHGPHRAVALETQCTFLYVRNVVVRALTPQAELPPWAGIVEEGFPAEAVTDPMRWYKAEGSPETLRRNVGRMVESCKAFLDLDRVESHPMSEYRITER